MANHIDRYSEEQINEFIEQIKTTYAQANEEIREKFHEFMSAYSEKSAKLKKQVEEGKITEADYKAWMQGQIFQRKQWTKKLDEITRVYVHADEKAREILGGTTKNVFTEAANYTAYDIEQGTRGAVSFNLYDKKTVEKLLKDNPKMLPEWKIDEKKDYIWNEKRVQNAVAQGIIQGESIDQIGQRLTKELVAQNANKMVMFARTAVTGAQNAGRQERLEESQEMGIDVKKKWLATSDKRTRDAHRELGSMEAIPVDEPFVIDDEKIMYPGDPNAAPELVYNCRCTLIYVYGKNYGHPKHSESYSEWEEGKERQKTEEDEAKKEEKLIEEERKENARALQERQKAFAEWQEKQTQRYLKNDALRKLNKEISLMQEDYSIFDRFSNEREYKEYRRKISMQIAELSDSLYDLREHRPRTSDYSDEELYEEAFQDYIKKREELEEKIAALEKESYELSQAMPSSGWADIETWRNNKGNGIDELLRQRTALEEELRTLANEARDLQKKVDELDQKARTYNTAKLVDEAESKKVEYMVPEKLSAPHTFNEIVEKVGGGDLTEGSCASLGFCYIGQKNGYDVLDFRDGESRKLFSRGAREILRGIAQETGGTLYTEATKTGTGGAIKLIKQAEPGKEYYFITGRHAAIIRRTADDLIYYLELQSGATNGNGWIYMGTSKSRESLDRMFRHRFGSNSHISGAAMMMDIEEMKDSRILRRAYGYMNTQEGKQKKGAWGHER